MADDKFKFLNDYYKNLARLFRSGPVVKQRIANKIAPPGTSGTPIGTAKAFLRSNTSAYASQLASYGNYSRLARYSDYCIHGDTLIWTIEHGPVKIKDLCDMYPNGERFHVYSYDHENKKIVIDKAHHPHPTKVDMTYKVSFENGGYIIANDSHKFMLRDGTYKPVKELTIGESLMPLYRGKFIKDREYVWINVLNNIGTNRNKKWQIEHRYIVESNVGRFLNESEVVHHKNFKADDNTLNNLILMTEEEHRKYHGGLAERNNKEKWENEEWREKFSKQHSKFMTENNPAYREDITFEKIDEFCRKLINEGKNINFVEVCEHFESDHRVLTRRLTEKGFSNIPCYLKSIDENWKHNGTDNRGEKNPRYNHELTFQKICNFYKKGTELEEIKKHFNVSQVPILARLKQNGFKTWNEFVKNYDNHKIISIEPYEVVQVYDLTTEIHHNFAAGAEEIWKTNHESSKIMQGFVFISNSEMETMAEISSGLDIYADETVTRDEYGDILKIHSLNNEIKETLEQLFFDVLRLDFNGWTWIRNLCKYGDQFLLVDHHPDYGIMGLFPMPVNEVEREEGYDKNDPTAYRYRWQTQGNRILENWQVIHFRILGNDVFLPYGSSVIEPARRVWRQLILMEDAVMVYRIVRSPERRVFYVDVGNVAPQDIPTYVEKVQKQLKRNLVIDTDTGQVDQRYNPLSTDEDYVIPIRGDSTGTRIETLPGGQFTGDIEDLTYIQNKLFAALKIPKSYLGYEGDITGKSTLSQEDIRFARTIRRIQQIFISELNKIATIQLFSMGFKDEDLLNFEITMANPSIIEEMQRQELWRVKFEVSSTATSQEGLVDRYFIYKKIFKLTDKEIEAIEEGKKKDAMSNQQVAQITAGEDQQPPPDQGGVPGVAPQEAPIEEPPQEAPPEEEEGTPITAGRDPNIQRAMPNELGGDGTKAKKKKMSDLINPNSAKNHVYNTKKNALGDPGDIATIRRIITSPFGEEKDYSSFEDKLFKNRITTNKRFIEELENNSTLNSSRLNKTKKTIIKG